MFDNPQGFTWPLMHDNVTRADLDDLIAYLSQDDPRLTHGPKVREFEEAWADWVGTRHAVMVNSGSSANDLTMMAIRELFGPGEVILSPLGWVSDVAAVLHAGLEPVFVDIDPVTLGPDARQVIDRLSPATQAFLLVHVLGLNALTDSLIDACREASVPIIEDVCESHGALHAGQRCGSVGFASNFSFYYAHHLTTIEGGMVCTNDEEFADTIRMLRSHGLVRESRLAAKRDQYLSDNPGLNPEFVFAFPAHNNRPTELNGVLGLSQLPRLDEGVLARRRNFARFMAGLDSSKYRTWYDVADSSNYAFILVLQEPDMSMRERVERGLRSAGIEFRRGLSGGGNQIRQPYLRGRLPHLDPSDFPNTEHVHSFGWYVGNHPGITPDQVDHLCELVNGF